MTLTCGIVGLPNVGKSTLFNALTGAAIAAENFPFCTVEPNTGVVPVPDSRLPRLAAQAASAQVIPAAVHFVDVAGLVRGAASGEGLGNRFLAHIRETAAVVQVLRCFDDDSISHVDGAPDPQRDLETVQLELILSDLEIAERAAETAKKRARAGSRESRRALEVAEALCKPLRQGTSLRRADLSEEALALARQLQLITLKPTLYLANLHEKQLARAAEASAAVRRLAERDGAGCIAMCNQLEEELVRLQPQDRAEMMAGLGLDEPGLHRLTREVYRMLGQISFFTVGPKEARCWTIADGDTAEQAAGRIHSDMRRGFIRAEVIGWREYLEAGGESNARQRGLMRLEGRDYPMRDGDVVHIRFGV